MRKWEQYQEFVMEINAKAGDAIIFSEACTHGTLPWNADHQRRAILYKYNTGHMAWSGGDLHGPVLDYWDELTPPQQATLIGPSHHSRRPKQSRGYEGLEGIKG
jgi:hypothetical protein